MLSDERVANLFGLVEDEEPPPVTDEKLEIYNQYLKKVFVLPIRTAYIREFGFFQEEKHEVTILDILDPTKSVDSDFYGIFCTANIDTGTKLLPLALLEDDTGDENYLRIDDYSTRFWNYRS